MNGAIVRSEASVAQTPGSEFEADDLSLEPAEAQAQLHWIIFATPAALLASSVLMLLSGMVFEVIGGFAFLFAVATIASACFNYASSNFAITGDRLRMKTGFIRPSTLEIELGAIEGIQVRQGFLGRMLGYGSIILSGNGGWQHPYHRISAPSTFCNQVERIRRKNASV